jgi:hypothetical protein
MMAALMISRIALPDRLQITLMLRLSPIRAAPTNATTPSLISRAPRWGLLKDPILDLMTERADKLECRRATPLINKIIRATLCHPRVRETT